MTSNSASRPPVPAAVKRQLRQESGFGCCRCGDPIVQFQHIIPWNIDHHFRPEDMMCLCPNCHYMATIGAIDEHSQRLLKARPYNIEHGYALGRLAATAMPLALELGSVLVVTEGPFLTLEGIETLGVRHEDGNPLVSIDLRLPNGEQALMIHDNEWLVGTTDTRDMTFNHLRLKLWAKAFDILFDLDLSKVPGTLRGKFWYGNGERVTLDANGMHFTTGGGVQDLGLVRLAYEIRDGRQILTAHEGNRMIVERDRLKKYQRAVNAFRGNEDLGFDRP